MKVLILVLGFLANSAYAESCSGVLFVGGASLGGSCFNSNCQASWNAVARGSVQCGATRATIDGSINGIATGMCSGGFANLMVGSAAVALSGTCSNGHVFSGMGNLSGGSATATCQPNGSIFGSANLGAVQVIGNCN